MCCATKNKPLTVIICKVPWSHLQRKQTYGHIFQRTSSPRLTLRSSCARLPAWRSLTTLTSPNSSVRQGFAHATELLLLLHYPTQPHPPQQCSSVLPGLLHSPALLLPKPWGAGACVMLPTPALTHQEQPAPVLAASLVLADVSRRLWLAEPCLNCCEMWTGGQVDYK